MFESMIASFLIQLIMSLVIISVLLLIATVIFFFVNNKDLFRYCGIVSIFCFIVGWGGVQFVSFSKYEEKVNIAYQNKEIIVLKDKTKDSSSQLFYKNSDFVLPEDTSNICIEYEVRSIFDMNDTLKKVTNSIGGLNICG